MSELEPAAKCGTGTIDGAVWRPGGSLKHLGPPDRLSISPRSPLFSTRCGLSAQDGEWRPARPGEDDDYWCPDCLRQAMVPFALHEDDQP